MAVDERARHDLRARLEEVLGPDEATTLMHYLPPLDWSEIATKRDLDQLADRVHVELHKEVGGLRRELHTEIGGLRRELHTEIGGLRRELHQEIGGVRSEVGGLRDEMGNLRGEMGNLRGEVGNLRGEVGSLRGEVATQSRNLFFGVLASNATLVGLVFAAIKLA